MRVVQLIDSLDGGGAERMAVNLANTLATEIDFSGLVTTRKEGNLKEALSSSVFYEFLEKKRSFDLKAVFKFRNYLIKNNVEIIHAHSSSFFLAVLTKLIYPKIKLFWHDHNGNRVNAKNGNIVIKIMSLFFDGVFTVNEELKNWALDNLFTKKVLFIPNFSIKNNNEIKVTFLKGEEDKRIVCLANLRKPKNHLFLLESFFESKIHELGWTLHLIGKDSNDSYSNDLKTFIKFKKLEDYIFLYGSCNDVSHILSQSSVGVLASTYEGFPVTLLEYGLSKLLVLSTNVGYCKNVIKNKETGYLFSPNKKNELIQLFKGVTDNNVNEILAKDFNDFVENEYSAKKIVKKIMQNYLR